MFMTEPFYVEYPRVVLVGEPFDLTVLTGFEKVFLLWPANYLQLDLLKAICI